jgi:hypothetical protein
MIAIEAVLKQVSASSAACHYNDSHIALKSHCASEANCVLLLTV